MTIATIYTRASIGIDAPLITVEVHLSNGLPALNLVGLPEAAVKESKDRVRSALINCGLTFPNKRITVLRKINRNKIEPLLCIEF